MPQQQFTGYSDDQKKRIASKLGHTGDMEQFEDYLNGNPNAMSKFNSLNGAVTKRYAVGGAVTKNYDYADVIATSPMTTQATSPEGIVTTADSTLGQTTLNQSLQPRLPTGSVAQVSATGTTPDQNVSTIGTSISPTSPTAAATNAVSTQAVAPTTAGTSTATTATTAPAVVTSLADVNAAKGTIAENAKIAAAQQVGTSVSTLDAAQGTAVQVEGAPTRTLEGGELVNPVADAAKAAAFTETITAAQADPSSRATVQGQLATLMTSFDEGSTPAWAAGAMRNVTAQMAARGIGSSSMAGQALIQAALESSLPIATADAQTYASFDMTNLNNRQQRSMLAAQQRAEFMGIEFDQAFQSRVRNSEKVSAVANMQFTADQQIAMENANIANTTNLANLTNSQAMVMAEAAALSQVDITNLNNRQQAQVQNARSFLDMDMANLANEQQTIVYKSQARINSMLSDAAAENASQQFNAKSENQTDQFFANLQADVAKANAMQTTAISQFNAGEVNAISKFNAEVKNKREQFNAQNSLVINQSNAQWRRQIATADTAAINRANEVNAKALLDISNTAYNNLWQEHRDEMDWVYTTSDNERDRIAKLAITVLEGEQAATAAGIAADAKSSGDLGSSIVTLLTTGLGGTVLGGLFGTNAKPTS